MTDTARTGPWAYYEAKHRGLVRTYNFSFSHYVGKHRKESATEVLVK